MGKPPQVVPGEPLLRAFVSSVMRPELQWARDAAVEALTKNPVLVPWAFEYTPPAAAAADEMYLQKVREADFVIWLVGADTSDAVRNEIAEAVASDRRLWVIRLAVDERSPVTNELIAEVRERAKTGDAADADELRSLLSLSFGDEVVRALRDTPGLTRLGRLEQLARASRARMTTRWQATGLSQAEAVAFADDLTIGHPPPDLLPTPSHRVRIVVADVGAGKSVIGERALQQAILRARKRAAAPVPVFLHARDITNGLEHAVLPAAEGLGDPRLQGAFVIVDGLDESPQSEVTHLIDSAHVLAQALPETHVLMTSRPLAAIREADAVNLPLLSADESQALMERVAGDASGRGLGIRAPLELLKAVRRPLFAILFAIDWRERTEFGTTTGALLARLVEKAIDHPRAIAALPWLRNLAVRSTDRDGAPVRLTEVGDLEGRAAVGDSRLVVESGELVAFTLPVVAQWFAAQSLLSGTPSIQELVSGAGRLDRWRYALAIAIATGPAEKVDEIIETLAQHDAGFAAQVMGEALSRWHSGENQQPHPDQIQSGRELRHAFVAWGEGLAPLDQLLLPHDADGKLRPLAISADPGWLTFGWYAGDEAVEEVVEFPPGVSVIGGPPPPSGWHPRRGGQWNADPGWAWQWGLDCLRDDLNRILGTKSLRVEDRGLIDEALWLAALAASGRRGSLSEQPIDLELIRSGLSGLPAGSLLRLDDRLAYVDQLLGRLTQLCDDGTTELRPLLPGRDLELHGGWIWAPYSDERQLERTKAAYAGALDAYQALTETWFTGIKARLLTSVLQPARLVGQFYPSSHNGHGHPTMHWHWEALPRGTKSVVDIEIANDEEWRERADHREQINATHERLLALRPEANGWITTIYHSSVLSCPFKVAPVATIAYEWLADDLKRTKWGK